MSVAAAERGAAPGQRTNIIRLAVAQGLAGANSVVIYATGAIIGATLAPDKALATLPISIFVVGMAACILPASLIARRTGATPPSSPARWGRAHRADRGAGGGTGLVLADLPSDLFGGAYAAVVLSFRFAAADCVEPEWRLRALSIVTAGGVAAGMVGPQLVTYTMDLGPPHMFAATFLAQALVPHCPLSWRRASGPRPSWRAGVARAERAPAAVHRRGPARRGVVHADELPATAPPPPPLPRA